VSASIFLFVVYSLLVLVLTSTSYYVLLFIPPVLMGDYLTGSEAMFADLCYFSLRSIQVLHFSCAILVCCLCFFRGLYVYIIWWTCYLF